ncbi:MAG: hypothetical protein ACI90G_000267 [Urechidicola sp.]
MDKLALKKRAGRQQQCFLLVVASSAFDPLQCQELFILGVFFVKATDDFNDCPLASGFYSSVNVDGYDAASGGS